MKQEYKRDNRKAIAYPAPKPFGDDWWVCDRYIVDEHGLPVRWLPSYFGSKFDCTTKAQDWIESDRQP